MAKKIIQLVVFLGLGVFFVWLSVKDLTHDQFEEIKSSAAGVLNFKSLFFVFLSMACGVVAHFFRALRNILLIDPLGYKVRKSTAFYSIMTCYLGNLAFPRLGEVLRCTFLQRYDQVPFQKSFGTVVIDRTFDLFIFALLLVVVFFLNADLLSNVMVDEEQGITLSASIVQKWETLWAMKYLLVGALLMLFIIIFIIKKLMKGRAIKKSSKVFIKVKNILVGLWQGLISIKDLKHPYLFLLYTVAIWVFYFLGVYMCFFAFDFLIHFGPMPAFVVMSVGSIGFMIAQGGLGAYPLFVAGILALYGVDYAQGLAAGWIGWSAQTLMILIVGVTVLILASFLKVEDRSCSNDYM